MAGPGRPGPAHSDRASWRHRGRGQSRNAGPGLHEGWVFADVISRLDGVAGRLLPGLAVCARPAPARHPALEQAAQDCLAVRQVDDARTPVQASRGTASLIGGRRCRVCVEVLATVGLAADFPASHAIPSQHHLTCEAAEDVVLVPTGTTSMRLAGRRDRPALSRAPGSAGGGPKPIALATQAL